MNKYSLSICHMVINFHCFRFHSSTPRSFVILLRTNREKCQIKITKKTGKEWSQAVKRQFFYRGTEFFLRIGRNDVVPFRNENTLLENRKNAFGIRIDRSLKNGTINNTSTCKFLLFYVRIFKTECSLYERFKNNEDVRGELEITIKSHENSATWLYQRRTELQFIKVRR